MRNFLNSDNILMRFLSNVFDLMVLNILFIISCIPIITIGTAISSMYYVTIKMQDKAYPGIIREYFTAFRKNFKQATLLWIPVLFGAIFLGSDLYIIYNILPPEYIFFQYPVWILTFVLASIFIYAFPLLSNYECSTKQLLKNSILISLSNIPTTIFFIAIHVLIIYIAALSGRNLILVFSLMLFLGFAAIAYFFSLFLTRIFKKLQPESEQLESEQ